MDKSSNKFVTFLAILATPLAAGAFLLSWGPGDHWFDFSPKNDGFVAPRDIASVVDDTQESTVTVYCTIGKDKGSQGTGWAIDSSVLQVSSKRTTVMTNHHVIEECIGGAGKVTIAKLYKDEKPASILYFDEKNDLAVLETGTKLKPNGPPAVTRVLPLLTFVSAFLRLRQTRLTRVAPPAELGPAPGP